MSHRLPAIPIEVIDQEKFDLWMYSADAGTPMYGPAIYDGATRIGQLIMVVKGSEPAVLP